MSRKQTATFIRILQNSLSNSTNHSAVFLCTSANLSFLFFVFFFYIFQLAERFLKVMNGFRTKL